MNDRQSRLIGYLKEQKRASVKKPAARFYVSEMTVRRDLKELELQGYLKRYNGGTVTSIFEYGGDDYFVIDNKAYRTSITQIVLSDL